MWENMTSVKMLQSFNFVMFYGWTITHTVKLGFNKHNNKSLFFKKVYISKNIFLIFTIILLLRKKYLHFNQVLFNITEKEELLRTTDYLFLFVITESLLQSSLL